MTDFYDWVRSPEIREYLRREYPLSIQEKTQFVCGAQRPLEDKYAALSELLEQAEKSEDRDAVERELRELRRLFEELRHVRPGQFYLCEEVDTDQDVGNLRTRRRDRGAFQTFDEVLDYLRREEKSRNSCPDIYTIPPWYCFSVEKWAPDSGGIKKLAGLDFYYIDGAFRPTMLHDAGKWNKPLNLGYAYLDTWRGEHLEIPLPFQCGDLIRLDPPVLRKPAYAVLYDPPVLNQYNRQIWFLYLKDGCLVDAMQNHHPIGDYSEWRLIDWAHPAAPSELPTGQEILADISGVLHEAARDRGGDEAWRIFSRLSGSLIYRKPPLTVAELLSEWKRS